MRKVVIVVVLLIAGVFLFQKLFPNRDEASRRRGETNSSSSNQTTEHQSQSVIPLAAATPRPQEIQRLLALGKAADTEVQITKMDGRTVSIRVEWMGDVATNGGDYIDLLIKEGMIRDFKEVNANHWFDREARSRWTEDFVVKMR